MSRETVNNTTPPLSRDSSEVSTDPPVLSREDDDLRRIVLENKTAGVEELSRLVQAGSSMNALASFAERLKRAGILDSVIERDIALQRALDIEPSRALQEICCSRQVAGRRDMFKGRITMYTSKACKFCRLALATLVGLDLPIHLINIHVLPHRRREMRGICMRSTVPQIFFNDRLLGGNDELQRAVEKLPEVVQALIAYARDTAADEKTPPLLTPLERAIMQREEETAQPSLSGTNLALDEEAVLCLAMRNGVQPGPRKSGLFRKRNCSMTGAEMVHWLVVEREMSFVKATHFCQRFLSSGLLRSLNRPTRETRTEKFYNTAEALYRYLGDERVVPGTLNMSTISNAQIIRASDVATRLRELTVDIFDQYLSRDGRQLDYQGVSSSREYRDYVQYTHHLQRVSLTELNNREKTAFFINVYNALVVHAQIELGAPKNPLQRARFFNTAAYVIGSHRYSLNDMEHGVLRANALTGLARRRPRFPPEDPRSKVAFSQVDPRIHFSLVCGAKGCPPVRSYSAENLDDELAVATASFLEGGGIDVCDKGSIKLSKLFYWYRADFGASESEVITWIFEHSSADIQWQLRTLIETGSKIKYQSYDWSINGVSKSDNDMEASVDVRSESNPASMSNRSLTATSEHDSDDDSSSVVSSFTMSSSGMSDSRCESAGAPHMNSGLFSMSTPGSPILQKRLKAKIAGTRPRSFSQSGGAQSQSDSPLPSKASSISRIGKFAQSLRRPARNAVVLPKPSSAELAIDAEVRSNSNSSRDGDDDDDDDDDCLFIEDDSVDFDNDIDTNRDASVVLVKHASIGTIGSSQGDLYSTSETTMGCPSLENLSVIASIPPCSIGDVSRI